MPIQSATENLADLYEHFEVAVFKIARKLSSGSMTHGPVPCSHVPSAR